MIVITFALGWIGGLLLAAAEAPLLALIAPATLSALLAWRFRWIGWLLLALVAAGLGQQRYHAYWTGQRAADVASYTTRSVVQLRGVVVADPLPYGSGIELPIEVRQIEKGGEWQASNGAVMLRSIDAAPYQVGDRLAISGVLLPADSQLPPYLSPLRQQGIVAVANRPTIQTLGDPERSLQAFLARLRQQAARELDRALPEPEAGLARGITLGERRSLGAALAEDFSQTNTSHILAVDGYKVGLVAGVFASVLAIVLPPVLAAAGTIAGIALYTVFVGASPSALRASIMGIIFIVGRRLGRPNDTLTALALAALAMTAVNPFLLWSLAFQLSFVTTLGLSALAPLTGSWLPHHRGFLGEALREALGTTLAAEIASAPLVIASFNHLSLLSLPVHAVVMPLLPLAIGLSALTAGLGMIAPSLGSAAGLLAWLPLAAIVGVVQGAGASPVAALAIPQLGLGAVVATYGALGLLLLARPNPLTGPGLPILPFWRRITAVVPAPALLLALALPIALGGTILLSRPGRVDRLRFLDVGPGDAALLELADGGRLYLQGEAGASEAARALGPYLPFWNRTIPLAVLSAGDDQGLTQLTALADRQAIRQVILPPSGFSEVTLARWQETLARRAITASPGRPGMEVGIGQTTTLAIYPLDAIPRRGRAAPLAPALALRLATGSTSVLWASADPADQQLLAASGVVLSARILKLVGAQPRWGLDPTFFQAVNPTVVILPAGAGSRFARPAPGTLDLLANRRVYRTDQDGTITITADPSGLAIQAER